MSARRMGAGEPLRVRAELLHESQRTRVTRLLLPGATIVRKEPLGPDADRRLQPAPDGDGG